MARLQWSEPVYEVADLFRERCLAKQTSLLWPDRSAWTTENINTLRGAFTSEPGIGKGTFLETWRKQLVNLEPDIHRVAADVMVLYCLFPHSNEFRHDAKMDRVREVINWSLKDTSVVSDSTLLSDAFERGVGHPGIFYNINQPWQIEFFLNFAELMHREQEDPFDRQTCWLLADETLPSSPKGIPARNMLLHLLFPDHFERIASNNHKDLIVEAFAEDALGATDVDEALLNIRRALVERRGDPNFDFYEMGVDHLWNPKKKDPSPEPPNNGGGDGGIDPKSKLTALAAATHMDPADLIEIESMLEAKRQIVLEGPPGSGKTFLADLFARYFVGAPLNEEPDERVETVQFHQSYAYEDFVQGIRPLTDEDGHLHYRVVPGIFMRLCELAARNTNKRFVLIIDEINRGNLSRIFGELLLLLEYREKRVRLPYSAAEGGAGNDYLSIPSNLFLIGTMNSTDRSLAQIDHALRRRFYFYRLLPVVDGEAPILARWLEKQDLPPESQREILQLFIALNERINHELTPDFQVGHSYFMQPDIATAQGHDRAWRRAIRPLLEEYFHGRRDRDELLSEFTPERLSAVLKTPAVGQSEV